MDATENKFENVYIFDTPDEVESIHSDIENISTTGTVAESDYKKHELEEIQTNLGELIDELNDFIVGNSDDEDTLNDENALVISAEEKQDYPEKLTTFLEPGQFYIRDADGYSEINWQNLAPFIQNIAGDLQKLQSLNHLASNVVNRIKNITENDETMQIEIGDVLMANSEEDF